MSCENESREKGESREEKCCVGMGEGNIPHVRVREWDGDYEEYSRIVWMEMVVLKNIEFTLMAIVWIAQWRFDH